MTATLQAAWLIHRRPFRNTSLTVDLFLPELGRVGAVVRGGRKDPLLAPFTPLWVELKPSGDLYSLRACEPRGSRVLLRGKALYCGFYLNELLTRLLHRDDPNPAIWPLYEQALSDLLTDTALDITLRQFELAALEEIGYGVSLELDVQGDEVEPDACYQLNPEQGLVRVETGPSYQGADLLAICQGDWHPAARKAALHLCRHLLAPHLGKRPLKSRELFRGK
ncbi:DNA repair protein RecO [Alcanivorax sp.]|jgi:DNA repair protein RecO (recombination protein O)|uniref:DNA repair protein RecO n=1 Tax=Alcanivorax sp. TaxID=1872427 RepID=UPI0032D9643B